MALLEQVGWAAAAAELNQPEHSGKIPDKSAKFAKTDEANGAVVAICRREGVEEN